MKLVVVDHDVDDRFHFYIVAGGSGFVQWHKDTFGHFYKTFDNLSDIQSLIDKHEFPNDDFYEKAQRLLKSEELIVVTSCDETESHFVHTVDCYPISKCLSEFTFIIDEVSIFTGASIYKREVISLENILDSLKASSNNKWLQRLEYCNPLYQFLLDEGQIQPTDQKYLKINRNKTPHGAGLLSTYLFKDEYRVSGLETLDFWDTLSNAKRSFCREVFSDIKSCREEWTSEGESKYGNEEAQLPF